MPAFTTIAAATSLAATGVTTGMSFYQANQQRKLQAEAEAKAVQAMADAKKKLDVNFYDTLSIQKEAYNIEKEALLAAGAQSIEAAKESERGVGATAGRVQMAQTEAQRKIASEMGQELSALEKTSAVEEARLRDEKTKLDIEEAIGAQQAAADAEKLRALSITQGMAGVQSMASQLSSFAPLYNKTASARGAEQLLSSASNTGDWKNISTIGEINGVNFADVANLKTTDELKDFLIKLDPDTLKLANQKLVGLSQYNPASFDPYAAGGTNTFN